MKKLVLMAAAIVAVSFASCGNKAANADQATATDSTAIVEQQNAEAAAAAAVDSTATDSTVVAE